MRLNTLICLTLVLVTTISYGESPELAEILGPRYKITKVGEIFTVILRPGAHQIQVQVIGNEVARAQLSQNDVKATIKIGDREWQLSPKKEDEFFILEPPVELNRFSPAQLKLNIHGLEKRSEDFEFKLNSTKP